MYGYDVPIKIGTYNETVLCLGSLAEPQVTLNSWDTVVPQKPRCYRTQLSKLEEGPSQSEVSEPITDSSQGCCYSILNSSRSIALMAHVIYEEQCYKKMEKKFKQTLSLHSMITYVLEEKETTPSNDAAI